MSKSRDLAYDPIRLEIARQVLGNLAELSEEGVKGIETHAIFSMMERPPEASMGDLAFPCFRFAKSFCKSPPEIASYLKEKLEPSDLFKKVEIKGAFLNFFVATDKVAEIVMGRVVDGSFFTTLSQNEKRNGTKIMVEYSQPNTHKEFHVGHARNVCLGDSVSRLFKYCGYQVTPVNYIGDEGVHIAKCLWQMENYLKSSQREKTTEWYGARYVEANNILSSAEGDQKKEYEKSVSKILRELESKEGSYYDLWQETRQDCLDEFNKIYEWIDASFDKFFYESEVSESSQAIVDEYFKKGVFNESEGAIGIDLSDHKLGFFIARKSDGNTLYGTKDLALAKQKFEEFEIDRNIYVVASEQNHHFKQVFKVLELMGFKNAHLCHHLSYGMVTRPDGKMSSRKGNSFTFDNLRDQVIEGLGTQMKKYEGDWNHDEIKDTAKKLAVGTIRYGMLQTDPARDIVFDIDEWISFEGQSGPYLMYSYARTQSIMKKAEEAGISAEKYNASCFSHYAEHELLKMIYDFNSVALNAAESYKPSSVAQYLFRLSKAFNHFYKEVSVLKAETEELKTARLALVKVFSIVMHQGLQLLGITPPSRM